MVFRTLDIMARPDRARSTVSKMILAISSARSCAWLPRAAEEPAGWPGSITATSTLCGLQRYDAQLFRIYGSRHARAGNHANWFDAYSPTTLKQFAGFGDVTYALTDALKVDVGARVNHYDYRFSSCISGWGSANGAATPSCSGLIALSSTSFNPKLNLAYTFSPDLMTYATVSSGFRPGGGNAVYPTTGAAWGGAFQQQGYTSGKWPSTYEPDRVLSYELGEKAGCFDRRLTVNASIYYEDWRHVQLEAYPNDWALNINGNYVHIYGADIDMLADLGAGFQLEVAAGYLYEYLDGGPHWVITPVHKMPEVAPESGTVTLKLFQAARWPLHIHSSTGEFLHRPALLDFFLRPLRIHRYVPTIARV